MKKLKENAKHGKGGENAAIYVLPSGERGEVDRRGAAHQSSGGGQGRGAFFDWVLRVAGLELHLANRPLAAGTMPNAYITAKSITCMELGHAGAWSEAKRVLALLGCTIERAEVSRVDPCVDWVDQSVNDFVRLMERGACIRKAAKWQPYYIHRDGTTGFEVGGGGSGLKMKLYDKLLETQHDPIKREVLKRLRWGGIIPASAMRCEFRVKREFLREHGVKGVEDCFAKLPDVCRTASHEWFRLVRNFDRKNRHHDRAKVHKLWRGVQERFEAWTGKPEARLQRVRQLPDTAQLEQGMMGYLTTIAAMRGECVSNRYELECLLMKLLDNALGEKPDAGREQQLAESVIRKMDRLESCLPREGIEK